MAITTRLPSAFKTISNTQNDKFPFDFISQERHTDLMLENYSCNTSMAGNFYFYLDT